MIDIREKDKQAILGLANLCFSKDTEIWAYGSRVKGTNHDTSDLDLVVHFPEYQNKLSDREQLSAFIEALRGSNIPIFVQVMDWKTIPEEFRQNIKTCYEVFWP